MHLLVPLYSQLLHEVALRLKMNSHNSTNTTIFTLEDSCNECFLNAHWSLRFENAQNEKYSYRIFQFLFSSFIHLEIYF